MGTHERNPDKAGDWVTNHPKSMKGWWPRRDAAYREGPPKATPACTAEMLANRGIIGIYLAEDVEGGLLSRQVLRYPPERECKACARGAQ